MKAVIMAGGEGTRLRPLTSTMPKPMTRILDKPIIEYTVELLKKHGVTDISFTLMYMPEMITARYSERSDINAHFYLEKEPLGTAGSVKNAAENLDETFIVMSGDALTDIDITAALKFHKKKQSKVTIVLKRIENPLEYGIVVVDKSSRISRFYEKPGWSEVFSDLVNTGIYIIEPDILDYIPDGRTYDFSKNLFPELLNSGVPMYGFATDSYWCDIGNIESFLSAQEDILKGSVKANINAKNAEGIWVAEGAKISPSALVQSPAYIGKGCVVKAGARIDMYSSVGKYSIIGENANIKRAMLGRNVYIGAGSKVSRAIICDNTVVDEYAKIYENSVVGSNCTVGREVSISPGVKIWPGKWIESNASVNKNVVWGNGQKHAILSSGVICGRMNTDISAEEITRLGMAAATAGYGTIMLSCDGSSVAETAKDAFAAGAAACGAGITDAETALPPELYAASYETGMSGCAYFKKSGAGRFSIYISGDKGQVLKRAKEKKINSIYERGEFKRVDSDEIKPIFNMKNARALHDKMLLHSSGIAETLRRARPDICVIKTATAADGFFADALKACGINIVANEQGALFTAKPYTDGEDGEIRFDDLLLAGDDLDVLRYAVAFAQLDISEITAPIGISDVIKNMAAKHRAEIKEANVRSPYADKADFERIFRDFAFFTAALACNLIAAGMAPESYFRSIPKPHIIKAQVACDFKDMGRLLRELTDSFEIECPDCGIKLESDKGWTFICPNDSEPRIDIKSEGNSEEFAKELCDFAVKEINALLKNSIN